jgi:hypothetical protein
LGVIGMARACSVCIHPARFTIDQSLQAGQSLRDISGHYVLSKSALDRHKTRHLPSQLAREEDALEDRLAAARRADQWHVQRLHWNARAVMRAMQGWDQVGSPEAWDEVCEEARRRYHSGQFLLERLGAEHHLDPRLMATLWHLRQSLVVQHGSAAASLMRIDLAIMGYYNALRLEGWIGDLALWIEHEAFGQGPLRVKLRDEYGARIDSLAVEERLRHLREQLLPVWERVNRQLLQHLQALQRGRPGSLPRVAIGRAGQVNVAQQQVNLQPRDRRSSPPVTSH